MYSTDAINWTATLAAEANSWWSVTYGNGKFVAVSYDGTNRVMYSTDGISWTSATAAESNPWYSVTYGDGKFVAVANTGTNQVMYSTDGINWTSASSAERNMWYAVTYGNGKFVAVAISGTNRVMYSTDGINWTAASAAEDNTWYSVTYGNDRFVAVSDDGTNQVMYSTDGISWTSASAPEANLWRSVAYGNGEFVAAAVSGTSRIMRSTDGINWSTETVEENGWKQVTYGDNKFVVVASNGTNRVMYLTTGVTALTLTDSVAYDASTGDASQFSVSETFSAGQTVESTGTPADTPAFSTTLYTGDGNSDRQIPTGVDNASGSLVWIKDRDMSSDHFLFDTVREAGNYLSSNSTVQQNNSANYLTAFNPDGFTLNFGGSVNQTGSKFAAWNFRAAPGFFDIQTWTGDDSNNRFISHSLASEPGCIISKKLTGSSNWYVYHQELSAGQMLRLDTSTAEQNGSATYPNAPTDTTYEVSTNINSNGDEYVAYLFADTAGLIK